MCLLSLYRSKLYISKNYFWRTVKYSDVKKSGYYYRKRKAEEQLKFDKAKPPMDITKYVHVIPKKGDKNSTDPEEISVDSIPKVNEMEGEDNERDNERITMYQ